MLLENRVAVVYVASGSIGGTVARTFVREGVKVFLAGRTKTPLEEVAKEIHSSGGEADVAVVDATDERTIDEYVDSIVEETGQLDVSFDLVSYRDVQEPLAEISVDVSIAGGASTIRQYLRAGLVSEFRIHLVSVLLGDGIRLFDRSDAEPIELERTSVSESAGVTHLEFCLE